MKTLLSILAALLGVAFQGATAADGGYLFVTFAGESTPMTEQVYFALSKDGWNWEMLNEGEPVLVSTVGELGVRDPYILRSHDGTKFWIIATDLSIHLNPDWGRAQTAGSQSVVIWESTDLVHWSGPNLVPVAPSDAGCTWAPEAVYDEETGDYLLFWASKTAGDGYTKQRIWACRTSDFQTFGEPFIYIEKPNTVIDTTIIKSGTTYYRFTKDELNSAITMESGATITGTWQDVSTFSLSTLTGYEGPTCFEIDPATGTWSLLLDHYATGAGYTPFLTQDLAGGNFVQQGSLNTPFHFRHGSVLALSTQEYEQLELALKPPYFHAWAQRPTMGWNSWDIFGTTVTEDQIKAQADHMAANLLPHGWDLITVDIQWYAPNPAGDGNYYNYETSNADLVMDGYGRLLPAGTRFPSVSDSIGSDNGFQDLADYVHGLGLRFGIHMMRGIPRQAVIDDLPVYGTDDGTGNPYTAQDIADTGSTCAWNPDMYGVDMSKPGAQEYYDSVYAMWASWGVDFVKIDDISRPYDSVQEAEIEAIRAAIDNSGREMVLSLSPGETPLAKGGHVKNFANQWRISDDFWDSWSPLYDQFLRLHNWTPHRGPGYFPDADMLPLGKVEASGSVPLGRPTNFTQDEQYTLMSLWSIARSPLIHGGDMTQMDAFTLSLMTNDEVIAVNQRSEHNHQFSRSGDRVAWVADDEDSDDKYLAVFNTGSSTDNVPVDLGALGFSGTVQIRSLWDQTDLSPVTAGTFSPAVNPHGAILYRLSGTSVLPTPWITGLTAVGASPEVTWEKIPAATSYSLKRGTSEAGPFTTLASGLTGTSHTDMTAAEHATYHYVVSAIVSGEETPDSPPRAVTTYGTATTVSWNLDNYSTIGGDLAGEHPGASAAAGIGSAVHWTNSWPSDLRTDLIDDTGNATPVDISYSGANTSVVQYHPGQDGDGSWNRELLNGFLNASGGASSSVTISEIPHTTYDIIVYFSSDSAGRTGSITDGSTTYSFSTIGPGSVTGPNAILTQTTDTAGSNPAANYAVFSGLSGTDQAISCNIPLGGGIAAFQIVPPVTEFTTFTATAGYRQIALAWNTVAGATSYDVYRSTVSGSYGGTPLTSTGTPGYVDSGLTNGTTYYYLVKAMDGATEIASSIEAGATPDDTITLFSDDLEAGFGNWTNVTGDTVDWTLDSGGTPSSNTGPASGANGSTWYAYLETSSGEANSAGDTAILESPVIAGENRTLTFNYHMYGATMGTMNVDVHHGGTWTDGVWNRSGQQLASSADAYTQATVDLAAYSGPIRLRFRGVAAGDYQGDMAIDDLVVTGVPDPPATDPDVHLKFDETGGTVAVDSSGNGWAGTLVAGGTWESGRIDNAVSLSGSAHVTLPEGVVSTLNDFTVSTWVNLNSVSTWARIFDFGQGTTPDATTGSYMFLAPSNGGGVVQFSITTSGYSNEQRILGSAPLSAGSWTHVAVTVSGGTGTLYVNGTPAGTNPAMTLKPAGLQNTTQNYIGRSQFGADPYLDGVVDDFRVYNRALGPAEVANLATDSDADGLADAWEQQIIDANAGDGIDTLEDVRPEDDFDGDGLTNAQESIAGTDPADPNSLFKVSGIQTVEGDVVVTFPSVAGKTYRLEHSETLGPSDWHVVLTDGIPAAGIVGTGAAIQVTDTNGGGNPLRFYRAVVSSP